VEKNIPSPSSSKEFNDKSPLGPIVPPAGDSTLQISLPDQQDLHSHSHSSSETVESTVDVESITGIGGCTGTQIAAPLSESLYQKDEHLVDEKTKTGRQHFWKRTSTLLRKKRTDSEPENMILETSQLSIPECPPRLDVQSIDISVARGPSFDPADIVNVVDHRSLQSAEPSVPEAASDAPKINVRRITTELPPRIDLDPPSVAGLGNISAPSDVSASVFLNDSTADLYGRYWNIEGDTPSATPLHTPGQLDSGAIIQTTPSATGKYLL
jgi:hypothetical protein